jgi:hypothetical protein
MANLKLLSKFEVLIALSMKVRVGLNVTVCSFVAINVSVENAVSILSAERRIRTTVSMVHISSELLLPLNIT